MHLMGGSVPPCRRVRLPCSLVWLGISEAGCPSCQSLFSSRYTWLLDMTPSPVYREEVFVLVAVSLRKESRWEGDRCRILPARGLFSPSSSIRTAPYANFCRFLASNFSHTLLLQKTCLSKDRWQLITKRLFRVPYSSPMYDSLIQFAESSNQNTYWATSSNWHLQIKLCACCCVPPSRSVETCSCHSRGCEQLSGACGRISLPFGHLSPWFLILLLWMPPFCPPERTTQSQNKNGEARSALR